MEVSREPMLKNEGTHDDFKETEDLTRVALDIQNKRICNVGRWGEDDDYRWDKVNNESRKW